MNKIRQGNFIKDFTITYNTLKFRYQDNEQIYHFRKNEPSLHFQWMEEQCKTKEDFLRYINSPIVNFGNIIMDEKEYQSLKNYKRHFNNFLLNNHQFKLDKDFIILYSSVEVDNNFDYEEEEEFHEIEHPFEDCEYIDDTYFLISENENGEYEKGTCSGSCEGINYYDIEKKVKISNQEELYFEVNGVVYLKFYNDKNEKALIRVDTRFIEDNFILKEDFKEKILNIWKR